MKAAVLLAEARRFGACFASNSGRIVIEAPAPLPDALVAALRKHKGELMTLLATANQPTPDTVAEWWQERAAIMQYDGGLPRGQAEGQASVRAQAYFCLPASYQFH